MKDKENIQLSIIGGLGLIIPSLPFTQTSTEIIHSKTDIRLLANEIPSLNETRPLPEWKQGNQIPTKVIPTHCFYKIFMSTTPM
jgi:hypothetical protein